MIRDIPRKQAKFPWGFNQRFNSIVLGDMASSNAETQGRLAVKGRAELIDYKVGEKLYDGLHSCKNIATTHPFNPYNNGNWDLDTFDSSLVVEGELAMTGSASKVYNGHILTNDPRPTIPSNGQPDMPATATKHRIASSADLVYVPANPVRTRTLLVRHDGWDYLNLAEIRVFNQDGVDVANTASAHQSSISQWSNTGPEKVIDGNTGTICHTQVSPSFASHPCLSFLRRLGTRGSN